MIYTLAGLLACLCSPQETPLDDLVEGPITAGWASQLDFETASDDEFLATVVQDGWVFATGLSRPPAFSSRLVVAGKPVGAASFAWTMEAPEASRGLDLVANDQTVITSSPDGILIGFDRDTGQKSWSFQESIDSLGSNPVNTAIRQVLLDPTHQVVYGLLDVNFADVAALPLPPPSDWLLAVEADSGTLLWKQEIPEINQVQRMAISPDGTQIAVVGVAAESGFSGGRQVATVLLSSDQGTLLWSSFEFPALPVQNPNGTARDVAFSPDGDRLVVVGDWGRNAAQAHAASDGARLWSYLSDGSVGLIHVDIGPSGLAAISGLRNSNAFMLALDSSSGLPLWESSSSPASYSVGVVLDESRQAVHAGFRGVSSLGTPPWIVQSRDSITGSEVWTDTQLSGPLVGSSDRLSDITLAPSVGNVVVAGTFSPEDELNQAVILEHQVDTGSLLADVRYDSLSPGQQSVSGSAIDVSSLQVFTAGDFGSEGSSSQSSTSGAWVAAHRSTTGELLWTTTLEELTAVDSDGTLEFDAESRRLFLAGRTTVAALDADSGQVLWESELGLFAPGQTVSSLAFATGPGIVLAALAGPSVTTSLLALDSETGQVLWSASEFGLVDDPLSRVESNPAGTLTYWSGTVPVGPNQTEDAFINCYETESGQVVWSRLFDHDGQSPPWDMDCADGLVISSDGADLFLYGQLVEEQEGPPTPFMARINAGTGELVWQTVSEVPGAKDAEALLPALAPDGATVFGLASLREPNDPLSIFAPVSIFVQAFDTSTGQERWNRELDNGGSDPRSGRDLRVSADGSTVLLAAASETSSSGLAPALTQAFVAGLSAQGGELFWSALQSTSSGSVNQARGIELSADGRRIFVASQVDENPGNRDLLLAEWELPTWVGNQEGVSVSAGGSQSLFASGGTEAAGDLALVLGSLSGIDPGVPLAPGVVLPLVPDSYTTFTLAVPNQPPLLGGLGVLDAQGSTQVEFALGAGSNPAWIGMVAHHAWIRIDATGEIAFASPPVSVEFLP